MLNLINPIDKKINTVIDGVFLVVVIIISSIIIYYITYNYAYKKGQIDALTGNVKYELFEDKIKTWRLKK